MLKCQSLGLAAAELNKTFNTFNEPLSYLHLTIIVGAFYCASYLKAIKAQSFVVIYQNQLAISLMLSRLQNQFQEITEALQEHNQSILDKDILAVYLNQAKGVHTLTEWCCIFRGKDKTPLAGGNYKLRVKFGPDYPFAPPKCWMDDGFQHYHVFQDGKLCYKLLSNEFWKLSITMSMLLNGIVKMLHAEPAIDDPATNDLADYFNIKRNSVQQKQGGNEACSQCDKQSPADGPSFQNGLMKYYAFLEQQSSNFKDRYLLQIAQHAPSH